MTREERAYNYASKKNPSKFTVGEMARHYDDGYMDGQKDTIDKACEWLKENKDHPLIGCEDPCLSGYLTDEFIENFKKAMEK